MTLSKAIKELLSELQRPDLTKEEKKALAKYQHWLLGIKKTVSNNTESWHLYPQEKPKKAGYYLVTTDEKEVEIDSWSGEYWNYIASVDVIAWAEMPKAYEETDK